MKIRIDMSKLTRFLLASSSFFFTSFFFFLSCPEEELALLRERKQKVYSLPRVMLEACRGLSPLSAPEPLSGQLPQVFRSSSLKKNVHAYVAIGLFEPQQKQISEARLLLHSTLTRIFVQDEKIRKRKATEGRRKEREPTNESDLLDPLCVPHARARSS